MPADPDLGPAPSVGEGAAVQPAPSISPMPQDLGAGMGPQGGRQASLEERLTQAAATVETLTKALEEERARRSGLDRQNRDYDRRLAEMEGRMSKALGLQPQGAVSQEPSAPAQDAGAAQGTGEIAALRAQLEEIQAQQRLMTLLADVARPGQPGEGLDLVALRHRIRTVPGSGQTAEEAQRQEVLTFIQELRAISGQAASAATRQVVAGMTPGSHPAPPAAQFDQDQQEFDTLHREVNGLEFQKLPKDEKQKKLRRYDQLSRAGFAPTGQQQWSTGWPDADKMRRDLHQVTQALKRQGQLPVSG